MPGTLQPMAWMCYLRNAAVHHSREKIGVLITTGDELLPSTPQPRTCGYCLGNAAASNQEKIWVSYHYRR